MKYDPKSSRVGPDGASGGKSVCARDVAIIGIAVRLPEADSLETFAENLRAGRDSVRELSADRRERTTLPAEVAYQVLGFLDDIDTFDHAFFGISRGEAKTLSPQHRLLLQTTYEAVENAGYAPESLQGSRTSLYVADTKIGYDELARTHEPTLVMGSHVSAMAGRVSRYLGLRGPSVLVDTACSSSLTALHFAVGDLIQGESELAIAAAVSLNLFPDRLGGETDIGIRSPDGKTRCFSADAAGTGSGEAVVVLVLKPLENALRDHDNVHAVIKSVALNHVGGRASTLTAPDAASEAEVIERAWALAGIDPNTVTFIEAHGTATRLGDPIEVEGLDLAFSKFTSAKGVCEISSAKSNFGHTWSASGLVGVVKAVLSLKNKELYPNVHSERLSPLIDFANSSVRVTQSLKPWRPACGVRRAGVSSFGVMGTNVHAVLEEAPTTACDARPKSGSPRSAWFPVSARSATALEANLRALADWLAKHEDASLADVQRTLLEGRGHFEYRFAAAASDLSTLRTLLSNAVPCLGSGTPRLEKSKVVFVVSGRCFASPELVESFRRAEPVFDRLYEACKRDGSDLPEGDLRSFAFPYAFHGWLPGKGVRFDHLVGEGRGRQVVAAIDGRLPLSDALRRSLEVEQESAPLRERLARFLKSLAGQSLIFVEAGPLSTVTKMLRDDGFADAFPHAGGAMAYETVAWPEGSLDPAAFFADLFLAGAQWAYAATVEGGRRIELPGYSFDKHRCWLDDAVSPHACSVGRSDATVAAGSAPGAPLDTRAEVTRLWSEILGVDDPGDDISFFSLGGDSIAGLQLANSINSLFGVHLDHFAIFDHSTLGTLVATVEELRAKSSRPEHEDASASLSQSAAAASAPTWFPYSQAQTQVWLGSQFAEGGTAFNLTRAFRLDRSLETPALESAVYGMLVRHEALRARFEMVDDALSQSLLPAGSFSLPFERLRLTDEPTDDRIEEAARVFAARPFDLARGPLFRVQALDLEDGGQLLTLCTHHVVADGWSLGLLVRDFGAFLTGRADGLPAVAVSYQDQCAALAAQDTELNAASREYWLARFETVPPPLDLPARSDRARSEFKGAYLHRQLPTAVGERLKDFSKEQGVTPFLTLLALFSSVLSRYSEEGDFVLGTSLVDRGGKSVEQLVSMLVRTVPLRLYVDSRESLVEVLARVRRGFGEALRHRAYSYESLVEDLRGREALAGPHLFEVLFEYEQFGEVDTGAREFLADSAVTANPVGVHLDTSHFPLNVMLSEQPDGFHVVFRFDTGRFDEHGIDALWRGAVERFSVLFASPTKPTGELPLLTEAEAARVRAIGYREAAFDRERSVHLEFERRAGLTPDRICLSSVDGDATFAQFNARANQLARELRERHGVGQGTIVALVMDRCRLLMESIVAVWKCGAAYMPVDPKYPVDFIATLLDSSKAVCVACDCSQVPASTFEALAVLGFAPAAFSTTTGAEQPAGNLDVKVSADALAYVIFTSGSTGTPKGAMIEHIGMLNHLHAKVIDLGLSEVSVVAQNAPSSFDISVWQMFVAPFVGGRTVIYPLAVQLEPMVFARRIEHAGVTVLEVVPSYLDTLLEAWEHGSDRPRFDALAHLVVTGEEVKPGVVNRWLRHFPRIPIVNAYGPTEASDDITHHIMTRPVESGSVPVGRPIPNARIYVLDPERRVVPEGDVGDIHVSGVCVGRGYLNDPSQTARVFMDDPFNPSRRMYKTGDRGRWTKEGAIEFHGRADTQVKVRGYRVDLGEIERRLCECEDVKAAAVVAAAEAKDLLAAFVVLEPAGSLDRCRDALSRKLPQHMVPDLFFRLAAFPLTNNGKIDRKSLAKKARRSEPAEPARPSSAASRPRDADAIAGGPRGAISALRLIWAEVLQRDGFSDYDRFFDLGGNSLRAIQVLSRVRSQLEVELTLETLFRRPTLAALAQEVERALPAIADEPCPMGGAGVYRAAPSQALLLRMERDYAFRAAFNRNDLYRVVGGLGVDALGQALSELARRHEALRTTFGWESGEAVQTVHEPGQLPIPLRVHDFTKSDDPASAARRFIEARLREPFDTRSEALVRADLLRMAHDESWLLTSMHQLVSDGRSAQIFAEELLELAAGFAAGRPVALPSLPLQPKDVAEWRHRALTNERKRMLRDFWSKRLAGASSFLELPQDSARPSVATLDGKRLSVRFPDVLAKCCEELCGSLGITEFVLVNTAVALLLMACTGKDDVTVGTYVRGRERLEFESPIGFFINTVPLRSRLRPGESNEELLVRAQREILEAFEHQAYPFGWTMGDLGWERGVDRSPIFDVMVALDEWGADEPAAASTEGGRMDIEPLELPLRRAKEADLLFAFARRGRHLELALTYNTDILSEDRARRYASLVEDILAGLVGGRGAADILTSKGAP